MRQNLTNVTEAQLDKVDSFYVVGSTTKEGLIEGRSNVKIDLKKAVAEGGGDFSTQLKTILTDASQHINLESSQQSVYFIPKYTFLFGPDESGEAEERRPLQEGTVLTMEQVFDAENYDFLKLYFGLVNIQNWVSGPNSFGSGVPKSILADYDSHASILFYYEPRQEGGGVTRMTIAPYGEYREELDQWFYNIYIEDPFNYTNILTLVYDYKTETFKVVEYHSNS